LTQTTNKIPNDTLAEQNTVERFVMPKGYKNDKNFPILLDINKREWVKCEKCGIIFECWGDPSIHKCKCLSA